MSLIDKGFILLLVSVTIVVTLSKSLTPRCFLATFIYAVNYHIELMVSFIGLFIILVVVDGWVCLPKVGAKSLEVVCVSC